MAANAMIKWLINRPKKTPRINAKQKIRKAFDFDNDMVLNNAMLNLVQHLFLEILK